jgi:hypothetical protein
MSTNKQCVTCQHYSGARSAESGNRQVRYEVTSKGMCLKKKTSVAANRIFCNDYAKWSVLK